MFAAESRQPVFVAVVDVMMERLTAAAASYGAASPDQVDPALEFQARDVGGHIRGGFRGSLQQLAELA
jgi:hypothetical protein